MNASFKILFFIALLLFIAVSRASRVCADQVILKDGGIVQGRVVEQSDETVTVEDIDGVRNSYRTGDVDKVVKAARALRQDEPGAGTEFATQTRDMPELVLQTGHSLQINALAVSPDGKYIASGSSDNFIKIWDARTYELIRNIKAHSAEVQSVCFSPDGTILASAGRDNAIRLWRVETGLLIREITGHRLPVQSIAFSPDGKIVASGSVDTTVKLWDADTGALVRTLTGYPNRIEAVAFSPNGDLLAGAAAGQIMFHDPRTGEGIRSLQDIATDIQSIAFSPDGATLASGDWNGAVRLWDTHTGNLKRTARVHSDIVMSVVFSPTGHEIASAGTDGNIVLQTSDTGEITASLSRHAGTIGAIAFNPDGATLVSGDWDRTIRIWSMTNFEVLHSLAAATDYPYSIAISPDAKTLAVGMWDKTVDIWNLEAGEPEHALTGHANSVRSVAFSSQGEFLASGGYDGAIKIWDLTTRALVRTLTGHQGFVEAVAVDSRGKQIASAGADSTVRLWDSQTGQLSYTMIGHAGRVNSVAFSPDGNIVASAGEDAAIKLWNARTGELLRTLAGHSADIHSVAFSKDGAMVVSASGRFGADNTVRLWDAASGALLRTFDENTDMALSAAAGFDGNTVAAAGADGVIRIWDIKTGALIHALPGHGDAVDTIAFSAAGRILASGSWDTTLKLWNPETGALLATLTNFRDGNWFVQDSAGRFDCSGCAMGDPDGGMQYIRWRVGSALYQPEQFFREYFEPGLLADVVKLGYVPPMETMGTALQTPPPEIRIIEPANAATTDKPAITALVQVTESSSGGAENVRLFVNGRPVGAPPKDVTPENAPRGERTYAFTTPVLPGENTLTAFASSRSGIDSREASVTVTSTTQPGRKPALYLVTVGINEYKNSSMNIILAVEDADSFAGEIKQHGPGLFGAIHDIRFRNAKATAENLRATLAEIQSQATFNDVVILYYAGHGANFGRTREQKERFAGGWYFITSEITGGDKQFISEHAFSDLELKAFLKRVKAGKVILVIDSCFSGALSETFTYGIGRDKNLVKLAYGSGATVLAAATGKQQAQAENELGHGVFTYFLLDGLTGKADGVVEGAGKNSTVEVKELADYTLTQVPEYTRANNMQVQVPFFWQVAGDRGLGPAIVTIK